ncbi:MAG: transposase family protein [Bosea sp.]|nr:transposase family protein [Bosea sp. (in: a-proteobacteria)]MCP4740263.1 transposase family protein [Bosea sp. (in: a-proteobacteria)]
MNFHIPFSSDWLELPDLRTISVFSNPGEKTVLVESLLDRPDCPKCRADARWVHKHGPSTQEFRDSPHGNLPVVLRLKRNRFKCNACGNTWMEKISSLDDDRLMTLRLRQFIVKRCLKDTNYSVADDVGLVVAPKSPDISHGAAWAAMNSRGERYPSDLCG